MTETAILCLQMSYSAAEAQDARLYTPKIEFVIHIHRERSVTVYGTHAVMTFLLHRLSLEATIGRGDLRSIWASLNSE